MILYDIFCSKCGYEKEAMLKSDEEVPSCPECGEKMRKATSCTSFILKGHGWALDGYDKGKEK